MESKGLNLQDASEYLNLWMNCLIQDENIEGYLLFRLRIAFVHPTETESTVCFE
jgi:hypothetical protein